MVKKIDKLFSKALMIIFLVLLVLGFTIPGFINSGNNVDNSQISAVEPRLCRTDADCYLICDDQPIASLCFKNSCQQNACGEYSLSPYQKGPIIFSMAVDLEGEIIDLLTRTDPGNFYVLFKDDRVEAFSNSLNLQQVLEKGKIILTDTCLIIDQTSYCNNINKEVKILVNGNETMAGGFYRPKEGDMVKVSYSKIVVD